MKLHELASAPGNDMKRLTMLRLMIERGHKPEIANASYSRGHFSWGDLEELGFAERKEQRTPAGTHRAQWLYTGPSPIVLVTQTAKIDASGKRTESEDRRVIKSGESSTPVEVDYS